LHTTLTRVGPSVRLPRSPPPPCTYNNIIIPFIICARCVRCSGGRPLSVPTRVAAEVLNGSYNDVVCTAMHMGKIYHTKARVSHAGGGLVGSLFSPSAGICHPRHNNNDIVKRRFRDVAAIHTHYTHTCIWQYLLIIISVI